MSKEDLSDFHQAKCDYYQNFVNISLYVASVLSILFLVFDYLINGSVMPTLIPRLSVLAGLILYIIVTHQTLSRSVTIFMNYLMAHCIMISSIWSLYHFQYRYNASEFFLLMNLIFLIIAFASTPLETLYSYIVFILEILLSHLFNHYPNIDVVIAIEVPCIIVVTTAANIFTLFFLDHYRVNQKLELAMVTDPLTQVYNRHLLEKIVTQNALKDVNGPVAIVMLDIDYFKQVNDEYGHYTGDLTLLYIGQKLSKETHNDDYVIRYGGEEFVIILKNCDVNNACARMEQFRQDIENATDTPVPFTISVGVSRYNGDFSKSIQNVDTALYKAKNTGRNRVVVV